MSIEIEVSGVSKTYKKTLFKPPVQVLKNVHLKFFKGICTGVMGHNGAGKTTTIRSILGLIKPTRGHIYFRGRKLQSEDRHFIGYMPEVNKLPANLTPVEILSNHLRLFSAELRAGEVQAKVRAALETVGLKDAEKKLTRQLSKGMARRLAWALATIHNPDIIILDEPTSGLDPLGRLQIRSWLSQQLSLGKTLILCTHELEAIFEICDEYYILKSGEVVYSSYEKYTSSPADDQPYILVTNMISSQADLMKKNHQLPDWLEIEAFRRGTRVTFQNHTDAEKWLKHLAGEQMIIESYKPSLTKENNRFAEMFKGGI